MFLTIQINLKFWRRKKNGEETGMKEKRRRQEGIRGRGEEGGGNFSFKIPQPEKVLMLFFRRSSSVKGFDLPNTTRAVDQWISLHFLCHFTSKIRQYPFYMKVKTV